jgi:hypothetical protein
MAASELSVGSSSRLPGSAANGWAWLALEDGGVRLTATSNAQAPFSAA